MGGNDSFIKDCPSNNCKVYPYRTGRNPARLGKGGNLFRTGLEPIKMGHKSFETGQRIPEVIKTEIYQEISFHE